MSPVEHGRVSALDGREQLATRRRIRLTKYTPLADLLARSRQDIVKLTFAEIEAAIAAPLPPSAARHREWWSNEHVGKHVQARSWLDAGYRVDAVDLRSRTVGFVRVG